MRRHIGWLGAFLFVAGNAMFVWADDSEKKELTTRDVVTLGERTVVRIEIARAAKGTGIWADAGQGTGFFIDKEAHLLTNAHVSRNDAPWWVAEPGTIGYGADDGYDYRYLVQFENRDTAYDAVCVGWDPTDFAIMHVLDLDPKDYDALPLGDSDKVKKGDRAYVIGTPLGFLNTFTECVVNGVERREFTRVPRWVQNSIQIRPRVGPGDSGGPLLNVYGEVVGVYFFGFEELVGLVIPINLLHKDRLLASGGGLMPRGYLGAHYDVERPLRTSSLKDLKDLETKTAIDHIPTLDAIRRLTKDSGIVLAGVDVGSPAEQAGLKQGDVIRTFDGRAVRNGMDLRVAQAAVPRERPTVIVEVQRTKRKDRNEIEVESLSLAVTLSFPPEPAH